MTDAGELTLSEHSYYEDAIGETVYNSYTNILYVLPDSICEELLPGFGKKPLYYNSGKYLL